MSRKRLYKPYCWLIIAFGGAGCLFSIYRLQVEQLDLGFVSLALITVTLASHIRIQLPRINGHITISDTFIFLTMLLYGGEAAVLLAAADGVGSSLRISKKPFTFTFNAAVMALSSFITVWVVRFFYVRAVSVPLPDVSYTLISSVCLLALVQYLVNSTLVAVAQAYKMGNSVWYIWSNYCFWNSITHFAGAAIACVVAKLIQTVGFFTILITAPIVAVVYLTYRMYLKNVEAMAVAARVEEAERHVAELSHHIAEQRRISERLQESEEQFRSSFQNAAVGVALVAPDGRWIDVNPSLCRMLGYAEDELTATHIQSILHPDEVSEHLAQAYRLTHGGAASYTLEMRLLHRDGSTLWAQLSASLVRDSEGKPLRFVYQVQDVTERRRAEEQLHHAAYHDSLTGLANRTLFADHLRLAVERARGVDDRLFAVLFMDLDRFKNVNDSLGHVHGDQLLLTVAARIRKCVRPEDTVARFGGDEFAILLNCIRHSSDAVRVAERIQEEIGQPFVLGHHEIFTSASIGITLSSLDYADANDILRDADTAMYRAKSQGKGRYEIFDKSMHVHAVSTLRLENELRRAVEDGEFRLHYQPVVRTESGRPAGFEALIRWEHPELGTVPPAEFIPAAEETDLILPIGEWVLREACRQTREWQREFPSEKPLFVCVNLSAKQFTQRDLVEVVERALRQSGLEACCLKLEITETAVMENAEAATAMLNRLRALGVQLGIDDFGTGYSSLSYLHRLPVNTLKVDRSFVGQMGEAGEYREIVRTIVSLAHTLGMEVVAEGVETDEQRAHLERFHCEYSQGYFFSKPLPAPAAAMYLMRECLQTAEPLATSSEVSNAVEFVESYPM